MKTDLMTLQDSFEAWYYVNEVSRREASNALNMFHNRQWAPEQIWELEQRGQPKETFNVVKLFTRMLVGYYSSVVNKAEVEPRGYDDITKATMMNDALKVVYEQNNFETIDDDIKQNGFLTGLFCTYTSIEKATKADKFGRNEYVIKIEEINPEELVIDPLSRKRNGSDSRGTHRFRWMSADGVKAEFGKQQKTIDRLDEYANHIDVDEAEFTYRYDTEFTGKYKVEDMYLVVHSVVRNTKNEWESVYWTGRGRQAIELARAKVNFDCDMSPYTVTKLQKSNKEEFYGIFREVIESQKAINQALIQIQLLANSNKVLVETDAVDDIDEFTDSISRVNSVIEVENLQGVLIQEMTRDIGAQYALIDKAMDRIKLLLGVNDAMLGMAFSADSGRKVKLQKNTGIMTLRYLTGPLEVYHKTQATLLVGLIAQFYTSHQVMRVTDEITGNRFVEINKPLMLPKLPPELAQLVGQGMPMEYALEAMLTGQMNPAVQQAQQQQQGAMQQYQQESQQAQQQMEQYKSERQQMIDNGQNVSGMLPPQQQKPTPPNVFAQMGDVDISSSVENSEQVKMNKYMSVKRPDAPQEMQYVYEEMIDPISGKVMKDKEGKTMMRPVAEEATMLDIKEYDIIIKPSKYDDEDEKAQLMLEVMLNGPSGQFIMNAAPAKYAKILSLNIQSAKTKHSPEIAKMLNDIAQQMGDNPQFESYMRSVSAGIQQPNQQGGQPQEAADGGMIPQQHGNGGGATTGKLPQNTNEG